MWALSGPFQRSHQQPGNHSSDPPRPPEPRQSRKSDIGARPVKPEMPHFDGAKLSKWPTYPTVPQCLSYERDFRSKKRAWQRRKAAKSPVCDKVAAPGTSCSLAENSGAATVTVSVP